jgi:hypothetical protein
MAALPDHEAPHVAGSQVEADASGYLEQEENDSVWLDLRFRPNISIMPL